MVASIKLVTIFFCRLSVLRACFVFGVSYFAMVREFSCFAYRVLFFLNKISFLSKKQHLILFETLERR